MRRTEATPSLTRDQQEIFCQSIARGRNLTDAYHEAGYVPHRQNAHRMYLKPHIQERIAEIRSKIVTTLGVIDKNWTMRRLVEAYERAAMGEEILDRKGSPTGIRRYDHTNALRALELIGKSLGMFVERRESGRPGDFTSMDSQTIEQQLYDEYRQLGLSDDKARALAGAASGPLESEGEGGAGGQPH